MSALQEISFEHEGALLNGLVALPEGAGPFPAVLVMHTALGLGDQVRQTALRLAKLGYAAIVTDMYGGGAEAADAVAAYTFLHDKPELQRARIVAWFDTAAALQEVDSSRIAAIGYCFGGQCVLELARSGADVKAVVSYHGLLTTAHPAQPGAIKGLVSVWTGAKDPYAPSEDVDALRQELEAAGARWQVTVFSDAEHGFTDPHAGTMGRPGISYNALADRTSWAGTLALLEAVLKV